MYDSPRTYNPADCWKGIVVHTDNTEGTAFDPNIFVVWHDTVPSTEAACTSAVLSGYRFRWNAASASWDAEDFKSSTGAWSNGSCGTPWVLLQGLTDAPERIAVSARTANTINAATRALEAQYDRHL